MKNASRRYMKQYTKLNVRILILLIMGLILLASPLYLRLNQPMMDSEPYFYQRVIRDINIKGFLPDQDSLSFSGRGFNYDLGPVTFLYILNIRFGIIPVLNILPLIFGLIAILLSGHILKKLKIPFGLLFTSLAIMLFSPSFLYIFTKFSSLTMSIPITLGAFALFLSDNKYIRWLSVILFMSLPFFGFWASLIPVIILLVAKKQKTALAKTIVYASLVVLLATIIPNLISHPSLGYLKNTQSVWNNFIFDLSGGYGLSFFIIILLFFGISKLWEEKYAHMKFYLIFVILLAISFVYNYGIIYLNFLSCFIAAHGFLKLKSRKWVSNDIKRIVIFILMCGLLFSGLTFIGAIKSKGPSEGDIHLLTKLKVESSTHDVILSHQSNGAMINWIARRPTYINEEVKYVEDAKERFDNAYEIFHSRSIDYTESLLKSSDIRYVYVTPDMKEGKVWNTNEEGFLFVSRYSKKLGLIYTEKGTELWRFNG